MVNVRLDLAMLQKLFEVPDVVVGDTDRTKNSGLVKLFQNFPALKPKFRVQRIFNWESLDPCNGCENKLQPSVQVGVIP